MIFAAGLGTRMRPLTDHLPKALIPILGRPLLGIVIQRLISFGYNEIVVNVHYRAPMIVEYLKSQNNFGIKIHISDESEMLLDTGGGLLKAAPLLVGKEPILVCNVDILSDIDFTEIRQAHSLNSKKPIATLAVRIRPSERFFLFNEENLLCGWQNSKTGQIRHANPCFRAVPFAFSGIQLIEPVFFEKIAFTGKFSLVDAYLELSKKFPVAMFDHSHTHWVDVGKPESIKEAEKILPCLFA